MSEQKEHTGFNDPITYRAMSEPFPSLDAANEAIVAFNKDLREIRAKHKLTDVYCIIRGNVIYADGHEDPFMVSTSHGNGAHCEAMTAWAFGQEQARRQAVIAGMLSQAQSIKTPERGK